MKNFLYYKNFLYSDSLNLNFFKQKLEEGDKEKYPVIDLYFNKENDDKGENHEEETLTDVLKQIDGALIPPEVNEPFSKPF